MRVYFVTMPYKDPEKRREFLKRRRDKNRERLNAKRRKGWQERKRLRVVLTPLTRVECQVYLDRLQRRKAATRDVECRACAERAREKEEAKRRKLERAREWKKANPEKVREYKRKWRAKNREKLREQKQANREKVRERKRKRRQANPEKVREWERKRRQAHPEKRREQKQRWRENNPEKVKAQRERERARRKARLEEADEEQARAIREKVREQKRRYREANREKLRERQKRWRQANPEKFKVQRKRSREAENARTRRYYEARGKECNRARRAQYARQKARSVPPPPSPPPPCDCGVCLACGGWSASWKPAWHARLNAFCTKKDPPTPAVTLEELPLDLLESETETLSIASTSEIDSELGDRLDALLADESDSEVETVDKVEAPTRRSSRIATVPAVSYQDWEEENPMWEFLKRKAQLHAEGEDRIVTGWEMLQHRTERVDAIVEEMSMGVDPTRQLDRFHSQLERQDCVLNVMVSEDLLDFVDGHL